MNGRLTVMQMQGETMIGQLTTISSTALSILSSVYEQGNSLSGIQQQIATSYLELQGIHEDTTIIKRGVISMSEYMYNWDSHVKNL